MSPENNAKETFLRRQRRVVVGDRGGAVDKVARRRLGGWETVRKRVKARIRPGRGLGETINHKMFLARALRGKHNKGKFVSIRARDNKR